jgi:haloacetate dehalogenase
LTLWGSRGRLEQRKPLDVWREWASDVRGRGIDSGHFLPEEAPDETSAALLEFLCRD